MTAIRQLAGAPLLCIAVSLAGCKAAEQDGDPDPDLVPPVTGQADIEQWFTEGHYQAWTCEAQSHPADAPSPHGRVRLCSNPIVHPDTPGEHPVDSALVIEIHDLTGAIVGRGAQVHTSSGTEGLDWYWYMHVPDDSMTPHDATGLAADGWGFDGPAADVCSACHAMAGSAGHEGHDFVWVVP